MFCRTCGEENKDYSIYCSKDGTALHTVKRNINLVRDNVKFCKECGNPIDSFDLYCKNCGVSLFKESKKNAFFQKPVINSRKIVNPKQVSIGKTNITSPMIYSLIGFGIVFIFSLIISGIFNSGIQEELSYQFNMPVNIKLLNPLDLSLLFNLSSLKVSMSVGTYGSSTASLAGGPFMFLLVPFTIFFILGIVQANKDAQTGRQFNYVNALLTGLFYGLILAIISLFSRSSASTPIPYVGEMVSMKKNFAFFSAFINGGLISILSLLIGYSVYAKSGKKDFITGNLKWLFDGLFVFFIVGIIIVLFSGILLKFVLDKESGDGFMDLIMYCQLGIYAFLMINLGSLNFSANFIGEKVSLIRNMDFIKELFDTTGAAFLYIGLLLPIVLFFIYGRKAKSSGNKNTIYTTLAYSIMVGILAYLTHIKLVGSGAMPLLEEYLNSNANVGFKVISSFIGSFVLSTFSVMAGFLLSNREAGN